MNQRIRELAEQSYDKVPHERDWDATSRVFNKEKFAELIVQECVNVLHDNELWNRHISHVLKEHFGVAE